MAVIGNLIIRMGVDTSKLMGGLAAGQTAIEKFESMSVNRRIGGADAASSAPSADMGNDLQSAMISGMAPLASIGNKISAQLNAVGGTVTTLARRIDASMKFPVLDATLGKIQSKIENPFIKGALGATRSILKIKDALSNMGDVAGRGLDRVSKLDLSGTARGAGLITGSFRPLPGVVNTATTSVKALGYQVAAAFGVVGVVFKSVQEGIRFVTGGVTGAMHLNETLSMTGVVFGESAGIITKRADEMTAAFGSSKAEFIDAAASFGTSFKNAGTGQQDAAKLGNTLAELGMDMASFNDKTNGEAFTALSAALRGEFDPLERFKINLTAARIEQEALAMGFRKGAAGLDDNAKKTATLALIQRQAKDQIGDLARTSDSASNQFRKVSGQIEGLGVNIGQALLPVVSRSVVMFSGFVGRVSTAFTAIKPIVESFSGGVMDAVQNTLLPGFAAIGARLSEFPASLNAVFGSGTTGMFSGFASTIKDNVLGAIEGIGFAWRNLPDLFDVAALMVTEKVLNLGARFEAFSTNAGLLGEWLANNWSNLIIDGVNAVGTVFLNLATNVKSLWEGIKSFIAGNGFTFEWTPMLQGFEATISQLPKLVDPAFVSLQDQIDAKLGAIGDKEAARAAAMNKAAKGPAAFVGPPRPVAEADKAVSKAAEYHATAALEFGSQEAGSAITRFRNGGYGDEKPAKETAKNTKEALIEQRRQTVALEKIANQNMANGQGGFSAFAIGT